MLLGLAVLTVAADQLVVGAARIAVGRRYSPVLVGMVIIGFGTSCPELVVSVLAALSNEPDIALGNIAGSNVANLSLLLGVAALISPVEVGSGTLRRELPVTVAAVAGFALGAPGGLGRLEGGGLAVALIAALWWLSRRRDPAGDGDHIVDIEAVVGTVRRPVGIEAIRTMMGIAGTIVGAELLVTGALGVATRLGMATALVGATLVAVGTSLPELVTAAHAARRAQAELVLGNLLGSNLFNALGVGGAVGLVGTGHLVDRSVTIVAPVAAVLVALVAGGMMMTGRVRRPGGVALIVAYGVVVWALS